MNDEVKSAYAPLPDCHQPSKGFINLQEYKNRLAATSLGLMVFNFVCFGCVAGRFRFFDDEIGLWAPAALLFLCLLLKNTPACFFALQHGIGMMLSGIVLFSNLPFVMQADSIALGFHRIATLATPYRAIHGVNFCMWLFWVIQYICLMKPTR